MYKNVKILNSEEHSFYRYTPAKDYYYAKEMNLIPITYSEIKMLCCDYPIVIIMDEETPKLMLMTGLKENNAIDENGQWKGIYVPSFLQRYPFTLVKMAADDDNMHIGFDLESGLFSSPEGYPLFNADKTHTEILEKIKKLLTIFQKENKITDNILLRMHEKGLFKEGQFPLKNKEGEEQKIGGFYIFDKKKFFEQEDAFLLEAVRNGGMEIIELHLLSLSKVRYLKA